MAHCNWLILVKLFWLLTCSVRYCSGQSENAVGAHRNFPKTAFSCADRPTGYYADIETGCQVYHMCDELGRQFSYSCPNTTLFQQRMLICDHWYMVNCSKAESDYTANLLIGQRDKPFVGDEENHLRTPRPDLLDRPYAPDYSGESFRAQYKNFPAIQNQITDSDQRKEIGVKFQSNPSVSPTHWKIPKPSTEILPPSPNPVASGSNGVRFIRTTTAAPRRTTSFRGNSQHRLPSFDRRKDVDMADLGTSHSTRYNTTSDDSNSAEDHRKSATTLRQQKMSTARPPTTISSVKTPSRVYETPFLHPIYNNQEGRSSTEKPLRTSTATPFAASTKSFRTTTTTTTSTKSPTRPTAQPGQPFFAQNKADFSNFLTNNKVDAVKSAVPSGTGIKVSPSAQGFTKFSQSSTTAGSTTTTTTTKTTAAPRSNSFVNNVKVPSTDLLPPHEAIIFHNTGTTEGPPIYYEWKIPSNGLLPPILDPPTGNDLPKQEFARSSNDKTQRNQFQSIASTTPRSFANNPFLNSLQRSASELSTSRTPISRSIKDTAQPGDNFNDSSLNVKKIASISSTEPNIQELRKELSIPDYIFPLEPIGRTGYIPNANTLNSFQLRVPSDQSIIFQHEANANYCPQCHPSFVKPGTCEPCVRR